MFCFATKINKKFYLYMMSFLLSKILNLAPEMQNTLDTHTHTYTQKNEL